MFKANIQEIIMDIPWIKLGRDKVHSQFIGYKTCNTFLNAGEIIAQINAQLCG